MKVAIIDPSGFTPPYDHHLCSALGEQGIDVRLYSSTKFQYDDEETSYELIKFFYHFSDGVLRENGVLRVGFKGIEHLVDFCRLIPHLAHWQPDVIHFQWLPLPIVDGRLLLGLRQIAPLIHTVHDTTPFHKAGTSRVQQWRAKAVREQFDHLIVHNETGKTELAKQGIDEHRITVIPHGILRQEGDPSLVDQRIREPSATFRILFFGTLKPYKGVDVLLRAFAALPSSLRSETELYIAGRAKMDLAELRRLAKELGIETRITWDIRFIPDYSISPLIRSADVVALPYRDIDQSGVLMTVLPYSVPIVASDIGGFTETLTDGKHGRLVPPDDHERLAEALATLLRSREKRVEMSQELRHLVTDVYSWETIGSRTIELYERLVTDYCTGADERRATDQKSPSSRGDNG